MIASVRGIVMEVFEKEDKETKKKMSVARLFQKGEKKLLDVKGVPKTTGEGEVVEFTVKLFPWANDKGLADIACSVVEE